MIIDGCYEKDDKTVLLDRQGNTTTSTPLTDFESPPRFEQLEERMVYSAHQRASETFSASLNALVASAYELLSEVVRLKKSANGEDVRSLKEHLSSSLKKFESRALQSGIESSQVLAARYVLCTVVDEAIVTTPWGNESGWSKISLLSSFHNETSGGAKFFQLLEHLSKNPMKHLLMLELMYVCLALGFQGKYQVQKQGTLELENVRDALYRQIRLLRGDVPRELSPHWEGFDNRHATVVRVVPAWMVVLFTLVCLAVMYGGFAWVLGEQRGASLHPYQVPEAALHLPQSQP